MIFHRSVYNDIVKYYSGNIIKLTSLTGDRLWKVIDICPDEVALKDVDGFEIYMDLNDEYQVDFPLPKRAVYQSGHRAMLLQRKPAKQYNRGIHEQNTMVKSLGTSLWTFSPFNIDVLQQFVDKPAYQDPDNLDMEYDSWAITPVLAVNKVGRVWALDKVIGQVNSFEQKQMTLTSSLFKPEITTAFPTWSVKC